MILNFKNFSNLKLNESDRYEVVSPNQTWNGGYKLSVLDLTKNKVDEVPRDRIIIPKENGTSIALSYMDNSGEESDYFWIPKDACELVTDDQIGIKEIILDPYKKWISSPVNRERFEDFIEDFSDSIESSKISGQDKMRSNAQDDVEIILDLLGISSEIESFDSFGDYIWDATLKNGITVEITKRDNEDLLSKFKIFMNSNDREPSLFIDNSSSSKRTVFNIPEVLKIEIPKSVISASDRDPYINYLIKRAFNSHDVSDQESLVNYFKTSVDSGSADRDMIKNVSALLDEFMDRKDIESLTHRD